MIRCRFAARLGFASSTIIAALDLAAGLTSNPALMKLRDVTEADLPIFFEHQREPDANRMAVFPPRERDAFMVHWRTKVLGNAANKKKAIIVGDDVVGNILSWEQDGKRFVGYWIGSAYWNRGIATTALWEFVTACEKTRPLYAFVAAHNTGSIRVLEKAGFRRVGEPSIGHDGVAELLMACGLAEK